MKALSQIRLVAFAAASLQLPSFAQSFQEVYAFDGGAAGGGPINLMQARDGSFYGMTSSGGASGVGTIFKLTGGGRLKTLFSFDRTGDLHPGGPLTQARNGQFYGVMSSYSEAEISGTVFSMTPGGRLTTLGRFTGKNGAYPAGSLVQGDDGDLYGVTGLGGEDYAGPGFDSWGYGTVFKITFSGVLTTLVSFSTNHMERGILPEGPLIKGPDGDFYGMTWRGKDRAPAAYRVTADGSLTQVASLCCDPHGKLVAASDGSFYGLAGFGLYGNAYGPMGLFWLSPGGAFNYFNCFPVEDYYLPENLIQASDGNLYGITSGDWSSYSGREGKVFKFSVSAGLSEVLSFTGTNGPCLGHYPTSLIQASDGAFYGTTALDGSRGNGNIFRLVLPGLQPDAPRIDPERIVHWRTRRR